jgi:hypothetical protein
MRRYLSQDREAEKTYGIDEKPGIDNTIFLLIRPSSSITKSAAGFCNCVIKVFEYPNKCVILYIVLFDLIFFCLVLNGFPMIGKLIKLKTVL